MPGLIQGLELVEGATRRDEYLRTLHYGRPAAVGQPPHVREADTHLTPARTILSGGVDLGTLPRSRL